MLLLLGILFLALYNTACGIFRAIGDSKRPLYYLIIASIINVILDLIFVGTCNMGISGAALATVIAQGISASLAFYRLSHIKENYAISFKKLSYDREILIQMIRIGFPAGIQNSVIAFANVVVQSNINEFGAIAMAGNGAYAKCKDLPLFR